MEKLTSHKQQPASGGTTSEIKTLNLAALNTLGEPDPANITK
jgi:hypothetical protein